MRPKQAGAGVCVILAAVSGPRHRIRHGSKLFIELSVGHDGDVWAFVGDYLTFKKQRCPAKGPGRSPYAVKFRVGRYRPPRFPSRNSAWISLALRARA